MLGWLYCYSCELIPRRYPYNVGRLRVLLQLNRPWRRNHRDSITEMLVELKWPTLEDRRKQARLMLLFKFVNKLIYVPNQYLPVLSPATSTRANHPLKLLQLYARTNRYSNSFLPRSIPDWNNLDMEDLDNIDLLSRTVCKMQTLKFCFCTLVIYPMGFANQ